MFHDVSVHVLLGVTLHWQDSAVLGVYVLLLLGAGWFLARGEKARTASGYFLAGHSMPAWAVAVSILATAQSAATFLGAPEQGFGSDLRYLLANLGVVIAAVVVCFVFIPVYYRLRVQTPYELLERRYGPPVRRMAAVWYLMGRFLASGVRVYVGAVPFCLVVFGEVSAWGLVACIAGFMAFGALFTLAGGVRAAIWSDVIQVGVYLGAAAVITVLLLQRLEPGAWTNATANLKFLDAHDFTDAVNDPAAFFNRPFNLYTAVTGYALLNLAFFAMDQDLTQRLLACKDAKQAARSLLMNTVLLTLPVVMLFTLMGLLMKAHYAAAPMVEGDDSTRLLVDFAFRHAPAGIGGLMLAGVLAAGPAGINSGLNSMASSFVADIYAPLWGRGRGEDHLLRVGRIATVVIGLVMGVFAACCVSLQKWSGKSIIDFALSVMPLAYAGLLGVFLAAVVFGRDERRRGNPIVACVSMALGSGVVVAMTLARVPIASPWQLCIGTGVAFIVASVAWALSA